MLCIQGAIAACRLPVLCRVQFCSIFSSLPTSTVQHKYEAQVALGAAGDGAGLVATGILVDLERLAAPRLKCSEASTAPLPIRFSPQSQSSSHFLSCSFLLSLLFPSPASFLFSCLLLLLFLRPQKQILLPAPPPGLQGMLGGTLASVLLLMSRNRGRGGK